MINHIEENHITLNRDLSADAEVVVFHSNTSSGEDLITPPNSSSTRFDLFTAPEEETLLSSTEDINSSQNSALNPPNSAIIISNLFTSPHELNEEEAIISSEEDLIFWAPFTDVKDISYSTINFLAPSTAVEGGSLLKHDSNFTCSPNSALITSEEDFNYSLNSANSNCLVPFAEAGDTSLLLNFLASSV